MFSDPKENLNQAGIDEGMMIADLGSGSGFYSLAAARMTGDKGRVFAVDVQKDLLQKLKNTAQAERIFNIEIIWGNVEKLGGTKIRDGFIDLALVSNLLFQIEFKKDFVREIKRILKRTGRVLVVDWSDSFGGMGPQPEAVMPEVEAKKLFEEAGFVFQKSISAGDHHYGLIFKNS
jgi:ubiquinone/menaquinone biosynthesis C-methylase UbiE